MSFIPPNIQFPSFRKSLPLPLSGATALPSNFTFRLSLSIHWDIWALTGPHSIHNNTSRLQHGKQRPEDQVRTLQFTCTLHSVYTIRGTLCALSHPLWLLGLWRESTLLVVCKQGLLQEAKWVKSSQYYEKVRWVETENAFKIKSGETWEKFSTGRQDFQYQQWLCFGFENGA